jgi:hypothetical protein
MLGQREIHDAIILLLIEAWAASVLFAAALQRVVERSDP